MSRHFGLRLGSVLVAASLLLSSLGFAEGGTYVQPSGLPPVPLIGDAQGNIVAVAPNTIGIVSTSVTCSTSSTPFGVSGPMYLHVNIPPNVTQQVCFAWNATAATLSPPSECYTPPTDLTFQGGTGTCIVASGSALITVITK